MICSSSRNTRDFSREIRTHSDIRLHRENSLAMKKMPQLHNAPMERCYACLGTANRRRAQWKALSRSARLAKNAKAFLKDYSKSGILQLSYKIEQSMEYIHRWIHVVRR